MKNQYFECKDCAQCRYDEEEKVYFCRRSYTEVDPEQSSCDDFEIEEPPIYKEVKFYIDDNEIIEIRPTKDNKTIEITTNKKSNYMSIKIF